MTAPTLLRIDDLALARFLVPFWVADRGAPSAPTRSVALGMFDSEDLSSIVNDAVNAGVFVPVHDHLQPSAGIDVDAEGDCAAWVSFGNGWPLMQGLWQSWDRWFGRDSTCRVDAVRTLVGEFVDSTNEIAQQAAAMAREWSTVFPAA